MSDNEQPHGAGATAGIFERPANSPDAKDPGAAVRGVVEQARTNPPKTGRHPVNCGCAIHGGRKKPGAKAPGPSAPEEMPSVVGTAIDTETIKNSIVEIFRSFNDYVASRVRSAATTITKGDSIQISEAVESVTASEDEIKLVGGLTTAVITKYERVGQYAPEGLLGLYLISYGYRVHSTMNRLDKIAKETRLANPKIVPVSGKDSRPVVSTHS